MQIQTFKTEELKDELERALGFELKELTRLDGASALNFKAVRAPDGLTFAVKCVPKSRQAYFDRLVSNQRALAGSRAMPRIFERELPATFRNCNLLCEAWCDGERVFPDRLTDAQFIAFLDDYLDFSRAMQRCKDVQPFPDYVVTLDFLESCLEGRWDRAVMRFLERELPRETLVYDGKLVRNIHSDFHHGNFLFRNGRVSGYMDLEEIRRGYPAEDIVRYLVCAAEHFRWYELGRMRRILDLFSLAVSHMPWSREEWRLAVNGRFLTKVIRKWTSQTVGPLMLANLEFKATLYRKMNERLDGGPLPLDKSPRL